MHTRPDPPMSCRTCVHYNPQPCQEDPDSGASISSTGGVTDFEREHVPCRQSVFFRPAPHPLRLYLWTWKHPSPLREGTADYCAYYDGDHKTPNLLWLANRRERRHRE